MRSPLGGLLPEGPASVPFPGFEHFYSLHDPVANRPYRGKFTPHEQAFALSRAEATTPTPVRITWAMGGAAPSDIVWTTSAFPVIVHARVIDLLTGNRFTGWTTYPVQVYSKAGGQVVPDFHGLGITGRCGPVDLSRSAVVLREFPGGWVPQFLGHYFVPDTWDGSDLFMDSPDSTGQSSSQRFVTEPLRRALRRAKIRNLDIRRLSEECVDTSVYTIGLQHLLPPDFDERVVEAYRLAGVPRPPFV